MVGGMGSGSSGKALGWMVAMVGIYQKVAPPLGFPWPKGKSSHKAMGKKNFCYAVGGWRPTGSDLSPMLAAWKKKFCRAVGGERPTETVSSPMLAYCSIYGS